MMPTTIVQWVNVIIFKKVRTNRGVFKKDNIKDTSHEHSSIDSYL